MSTDQEHARILRCWKVAGATPDFNAAIERAIELLSEGLDQPGVKIMRLISESEVEAW